MSSYGVAMLVVIELYKKWRDPWYEPSGPILVSIIKSAFLQKDVRAMSGDERSEHLYREWIKSGRNLYGVTSFYRVDNVLSLADLLVRQMRFPEAEAWYDYARRLTVHNFGESDRRLAPVLTRLAELHLRTGRYALALERIDQALTCLRQGAEDSPEILPLLKQRAETCLRAGDSKAAVASMVERINLLIDKSIVLASKGALNTVTDSVLESEARALVSFACAAGDTETAAIYQRYVNCLSALSVAHAALGHDSAYLGNDLNNLAHFYRQLGRHELAQALSRQAQMLRLWQRVSGVDYRGIEHDLQSVADWLKERNGAADLTVAFHLEQRIKRIKEKRKS
jgi:tetratricopeptide (TPR) repeat protein